MLSAVVPVLVYIAVLYVPGMALARLLRLRGLPTVAVAPALTFAVAGVSTPLLGKLDIRWNLGTAAACFAVFVLVSWALGRFVLSRGERAAAVPADKPGTAHVDFASRTAAAGTGDDKTADEEPVGVFGRKRTQLLVIVLGIVAGAAAGLVQTVRGMGNTINTINQGWDPAWHANFTQWITDTGLASPLRAGLFQNWASGASTYYPSATHAVRSLVQQITGTPAYQLVNVDMLLMAGLLIPLGIAALTWYVSGRNAIATALAAAIAPWFSIFPTDEIWRTALPFALGLALVGPVLVVLLTAVTERPRYFVAAGLAILGIAAMHTSLAFCVAFFVIIWFAVRLLRPRRHMLREAGVLVGAAVVAALGLLPQINGVLGSAGHVAAFDWRLGVSTAEAARQVFGLDYGSNLMNPNLAVLPGQYVLAALVLVGGLFALRHRRTAWLTLGYLFFSLLALHGAAPRWEIVKLLTTPWYSDPWRLAAIAVVVGAPLVGIGLAGLAGLPRLKAPVTAAIATGLAVVAFLVTGFGYSDRNADRVNLAYDDHVLDKDEVRAMRELAALTGGQGRVLNAPYDGSVWMYSVAGQKPVFVHYDIGRLNKDEEELTAYLNQWNTNPRVSAAAERLGVRYLYLATGQIYKDMAVPPGYAGIENVPGFKVVIDTGTAKVYEFPRS